jgi:hypothetical protein
MIEFRKVEEPHPHSVTVSIWEMDGKVVGEPTGPTLVVGGRIIRNGWLGDPVEVPHALIEAIKRAKKYDCPIVIMDPESLWRPEWGRLRT